MVSSDRTLCLSWYLVWGGGVLDLLYTPQSLQHSDFPWGERQVGEVTSKRGEFGGLTAERF